MAAEGRISTFPFASSLVLEFCLKVANVQLAFSFKMAGKKVAGGVLRAGKRFFFFTCKSCGREKRALLSEKIKLCFETNARIMEPPAPKANLLG